MESNKQIKKKTGVEGEKIWKDGSLKSERISLEMRVPEVEPCREMSREEWGASR